jgi:hypothetical protein
MDTKAERIGGREIDRVAGGQEEPGASHGEGDAAPTGEAQELSPVKP